MPNLRIETNVSRDQVKDMSTCLAELSKAVSASTGKPEQYVCVQIITDVPMMFGGTDGPCASAFFNSIGKVSAVANTQFLLNYFFFSQIGAEENKGHAAAICPIVNKYLGVAEDRMYILFNDASYQNMGWKGTTFAAILGK